jgi:N-acetylmuramoyl-L-alanine amidase
MKVEHHVKSHQNERNKMKVVISSGHGKNVRGAAGPEPWGLDEVDEARRVVDRVAEILGDRATTYHDNSSQSQSENLNRIVDFHNSQIRDLDCSIHFNAYQVTDKGMGTECLYVSQDKLAKDVADDISSVSGLTNRGPKKRTDLFFLNNTNEPAILVETAFVDSKSDAELYQKHFEGICKAISKAIMRDADLNTEIGVEELLTIGQVTIYGRPDGTHVRFTSDLDICNDGSGPSHGDPSYQSQTAYYNNGKFLNADQDKYIVIPPQIRKMVAPTVMGCQARLSNLTTGAVYDGVTGEIGPDDKTGEAAYCLSKIVNPSITHNSGDKSMIYLYELWPGVAAVVDGKTYKLESA